MPDAKTISFYDNEAERYAKLTHTDSESDNLIAFMELLPEGGSVLDLGCGPANASAYMRNRGIKPDPVDASQGMVDLANATHNIGARILTFDEIDMVDAYDGVWANFSLLHAKREELPQYLAVIFTALRRGGIFHIAMKVGDGSGRDTLERRYTYVTSTQLKSFLVEAGFEMLDIIEGCEIGCAGTNDPFVAIRAVKND